MTATDIERMGTGTGDMIRRCHDASLPEPEFRLDGGCFVLTLRRKTGQVTGQVTPQVAPQDNMLYHSVLRELAAVLSMVTPQVTGQVVSVLEVVAVEDKPRVALQEAAALKDREHFRESYLEPLVNAGWLARTIPDKPASRLQTYRLTEKGRAWLRKART